MILAKELHKPVRKKFPKRRIFTKGIDDLWAADLVIMRNYSDENKGYSYIITVIDTFSKFSWALELKKKDGINVSEAFKKIIKQAISQNHQAPKLLHADKVKENIINNKMNKKFTYPPKTCDKCNLTVGCKNWAAHLKSIRHQKNDIEQTIVPFRFNKTYKGIPINQEKQKNYNYLKLMQNDIKKSIQKNKCYVKFCAFEYYENCESVKYTLNKIPIEGNIFIISQGDDYFGNGNPYVSKLLHSPTWLELCKIANEQIIATDNPVIGQLKHALKKKNLKVNIMFLAIYKRGTNEENMEYKECNFKTTNKILTTNSDLNVYYTNEKIKIVNEIEEFVMKNSQWRLHQILSLGININKYVPFKGSSYIPLPKHIGDKKAIINVQNKDDKCFLWAILSALHPVEKNPQRVTLNIFLLKMNLIKNLKILNFH
ncbi:hypothetical protein QTP88_028750 [Uroleucon formosanum]